MHGSHDQGKCRNCPLTGPGGAFGFLLRPEYEPVIEKHSRLLSFRPGGTIISQGEPVDGWQVLRTGAARIFMGDRDGHEHTVRFARPGDLIGGCAGAALGDSHDNCYAAVATGDPTEVCHFPAYSLATIFEECPTLAETFLGLMVRHLSDSYERLQSLSTTTVRERLLDALVRLAGPTRSATAGAVTLYLARQQLADILGVTKETAVRALGYLKDRGLIVTRGQAITIVDVNALKALRDGQSA